MKSRAIWQAYADTGALDVACPNCGAKPGIWCVNEITDRVRRTPCLARTTATGTIESAKYGRDFTEPRRGPEEPRS